MKKLKFNSRKIRGSGISTMIKMFALGLVAVFCLVSVGGSKNAEINSFLTE